MILFVPVRWSLSTLNFQRPHTPYIQLPALHVTPALFPRPLRVPAGNNSAD